MSAVILGKTVLFRKSLTLDQTYWHHELGPVLFSRSVSSTLKGVEVSHFRDN